MEGWEMSFTAEDVKRELKKIISDRSNYRYHYLRYLTVYDVVEKEPGVFKISYLDHEDFDILTVRIADQEDIEETLYYMKRGVVYKECFDTYFKTMTFLENLKREFRMSIKDAIEFGIYWEANGWSPEDGGLGYIQVKPAVYEEVYDTGLYLKIHCNLRDLIYLNDEETESAMKDLVKIIEDYALDMKTRVYKKDPLKDKHASKGYLYGMVQVEKEYTFKRSGDVQS